MTKIGYRHLYMRGESKKTKGSKQDSQNRLLSPMTEGGEQENQKVQTGWPK